MDHKLHLNNQCAAKVKAICRNPHMQTHILPESWQTTLTWCDRTQENYFGPMQVIPVQAGNKLKEAKEKYTGIYVNTHTHQKAIDGARGVDLHTVMNNKLYPKEGRQAMHGRPHFCYGMQITPLGASWLWSPLSHCAWVVSAQAVGKRKAKLERRKDTNLLLWQSALLSGIILCCFVTMANPWHVLV